MRGGKDGTATVLFIHGTGTRGEGHAAAFRNVGKSFEKNGIDAGLESFYWGEHLGAALEFEGRSVPNFDETDRKTIVDDSDEQQEYYWETLAYDPLHLLRVGAVTGQRLRGRIGSETIGQHNFRRISEYSPSAETRNSEIGPFLDDGVQFVRSVPTLRQASDRLQYSDLANSFARAVIGYCLHRLLENGVTLPPLAARQNFVRRMVADLGGEALGRAADAYLAPVVFLAKRNRAATARGAAKAIGDIMRFVHDPRRFRAALHARLNEIEATDVILLGHSLGGVIAADLLLNQPHPKVTGLITVGSQAGMLREFDILPAADNAIFERIPWLNVYHERDLLSYLAGPVFPGNIEDYRIANWQPFPSAHSSYLRPEEKAMWAEIQQFVQRAGR